MFSLIRTPRNKKGKRVLLKYLDSGRTRDRASGVEDAWQNHVLHLEVPGLGFRV